MRTATLVKYMDRWALRAIAIAALLTILFFLASLVIIYWGDEYASPAWDEQSVPAPKTY
jgi:TRAP-type C4-dicarboxylate transport system permease small subunit